MDDDDIKYRHAVIRQKLKGFYEVLSKFPGALRRNGSRAHLSKRHTRRLIRRLQEAGVKECVGEKDNPYRLTVRIGGGGRR